MNLKPVIMASVLAMGAATASAGDAMFTPELLNSLGRVSDQQVSPDGTKVLFGVSTPNIKENKSNRELWVMNIDGSNAHQITNSPKSETNGVWINNDRIAFAYPNENGVNQVWTMNADGSNRVCASDMKKDVEGFVISPDGKKMIVVSTVKYRETAHDRYPDLDKTDGRIIDDLMYRHWNEWTEEIPQPFVADFDGTKVTNAKNVLEGTQFESPMRPWGGIEQLAWLPDSKSFIYVCRKKTGKDYAVSTNSDLYQYDIASGETKNLTEGMMGYDNNPIVSKSGKIAWLSMERDGYEADKNRIMLMDQAGGTKIDLTANWDYSVDEIAWSADEKFIYFICPYLGTCPMFRLDVTTKKVEQLAGGQYDYSGINVVNKDLVLVGRHSYLDPNEIYSVAIGKKAVKVSDVMTCVGKEPVKLSKIDDEIMNCLAPVTCIKEMAPATDGAQITTWVLLPPNFDPNKKYPSIFFCEGGPQSAVSQFWSYRWNMRIMAAHGYVVIAPNRRGLPGFGTKWNEEISGDYAGQCMKDYLSTVDYMKTKPYIDGDHMGCVGASFGGYSVYWLAGNHEGRFACFLSHAGIFDLRAQYCETEEMWFVNWDLGGAPWEKDNAMAKKSYSEADPKNYVQNWDKPILCVTGENDFRISYSQTMQAFNAAKMRGLEARMVLFPSECHWVTKPQNSILWQREYFRWLDQWLKK